MQAALMVDYAAIIWNAPLLSALLQGQNSKEVPNYEDEEM